MSLIMLAGYVCSWNKCRELGFRPRSVQFEWMDVDGSLEYQLCVCSMCPRSYSILRYWRLRNPVRHCQHTARINCSQKRTLEKGSYTLNSLTAVAAWIIIICRPASWHMVSWHPCVEHIPMHLPKSQHGQILWPAVEHVYWFPSVKRWHVVAEKVRNPLVQTHHGFKHWNDFNIESIWS